MVKNIKCGHETNFFDVRLGTGARSEVVWWLD